MEEKTTPDTPGAASSRSLRLTDRVSAKFASPRGSPMSTFGQPRCGERRTGSHLNGWRLVNQPLTERSHWLARASQSCRVEPAPSIGAVRLRNDTLNRGRSRLRAVRTHVCGAHNGRFHGRLRLFNTFSVRALGPTHPPIPADGRRKYAGQGAFFAKRCERNRQ